MIHRRWRSEQTDAPCVSRERAILAEDGCVYITRRGSEMARGGYMRRPGREHLGSATEGRSETPGRRARIPSQRQMDALIRAAQTVRSGPHAGAGGDPPRELPASPRMYAVASPVVGAAS